MADNETIFSKIIRKEVPADIVFENDEILAFKDINPQAPVHLLVIPKKPLKNLDEASVEDKALLGELLYTVSQLAKQEGISDGYRVVINCGEKAGQTVFHLHLHLLGGRQMEWPPG